MDERLDTIADLLRTLTVAGKVEWRTYPSGVHQSQIGDYVFLVKPGAGPNDTRLRVKNRRGRVLYENLANRVALIAAIGTPPTDTQRLDTVVTYLQGL